MTSRPHRLRGAVALLAVLPALAVLAPATPADAAPEQVAPATAARMSVAVTGRVVRFTNGRPARGVRVSAYDAGETDFLGADLTDEDGRFGIRVGDQYEEFGIYVRGARVGLQNGWLGCDRTLKPTFGDACTFSAAVGRIRIKAA
ncbi:hypothetical protein [Nocardioides rubriscoriae]|uniref:hypothetical protein n=1 Tax=Nocardioides rubriscoriae TaxID=642762 RepID=UPI00147895E1|nr:hypothetical protein [Nocardioides rubriscoriae]